MPILNRLSAHALMFDFILLYLCTTLVYNLTTGCHPEDNGFPIKSVSTQCFPLFISRNSATAASDLLIKDLDLCPDFYKAV